MDFLFQALDSFEHIKPSCETSKYFNKLRVQMTNIWKRGAILDRRNNLFVS